MASVIDRRVLFYARSIFVCASIAVASSALAADDSFFEPIDIDLENSAQTATEEESSGIDDKGFIQQKFKYGLQKPLSAFGFDRDESGLSQVQTDWFHEWRGEFAPDIGWQFGVKAEVDWLQWENGEQQWQPNHENLFLKDAFVDAVFDNGVWLRAGHQVFAWRRSDSLLAVTDVLSPMDLREPGQAELQDIREQVPAVMVSVPVVNTKFITVVTYDAGHHRYADKDEEFYPYIALSDQGIRIDEQEPEKEWELAFKLDYYFNGGDISLVAAETNDNDLAFQGLTSDFSTAVFTQERVRMVGVSANRVKDNWLLKAELGRFWDQPLPNTAGEPWQAYNQVRSLLGAEYNGWDNWRVNLELNSIYLSDDEPMPESAGTAIDRSPLGYLVMVSNSALNDRLENRFWLMDIIGSEGKVFRWDLTYDISDHWEAGATTVVYEMDNPDSTLYPFRNHDSLNFSIAYYY